MKNSKFAAHWCGVWVWAFCLALVARTDAGQPSKLPAFEDVAQIVTVYFRSQPDYQPTDLVSQRNVAETIEAIAQIGWAVPDADKIVEMALADDSFLVRTLATSNGKKFMRKIARSPGTYVRLDRLSKISNGENVVKVLIKDPGGDTMITYMATTKGGHNLGAMMAGTPNGTSLNKPTGRIYTADDLMAVLKKAYAKSIASQNAPDR